MAESASIDLLEEKKPLSEILASCKTIAKLLRISDVTSWIDLEINGYLVRYKTRDQLSVALPSYRKTDWKFYDLYGNLLSLPPDIVGLFGKSVVYHPVSELENSSQIVVGDKLLDDFNKFISTHGMDYASKNVRIHEAKISKMEIGQVLEGIKKKVHEFLDMVIAMLEPA